MASLPRYFTINLSVKDPQGRVYSAKVAFSKRAKRNKSFTLPEETGKDPSFIYANTAVLKPGDFKTDLYCQVFLPGRDFLAVRFFLRYPSQPGRISVATGQHFSTGQFTNWSAKLLRKG